MKNKISVMSLLIGLVASLHPIYANSTTMPEQAKTKANVLMNIDVNSKKQLVFNLSYCDKQVIMESPLGLNIDNQLLGENVEIKDRKVVEENTITYTLQQSNGAIFYLDTRIFPDGAALRVCLRIFDSKY